MNSENTNSRVVITSKQTNIFYTVIFSILLILCITLLFSTARKPTIASFDFKTTYATFLKEAAHNKLSEEKIAILGKRFPEALNSALSTYATKHHAVVFVSNAVMAGAVDATPEIQNLIAQEMQKLAEAKRGK